MKLSSLLLGLSLFGQTVLSHPLDLPFRLSEDEMHTLEKRQSAIVATTGSAGSTQPRLEIRQMQSQQPNQFTLLILALQRFQAQAQTSATSYYQISGIHGVPRQNYNNVGQCSSCSGADGYCTHDSVLFPAWHRAYVALFEQQFVKVATNIANTWPTSGAATTRAQMQAAASTIRWPYWDWAAQPPNGGNNFPDVVAQNPITINAQTGSKTIANPLFSYKFASTANLVYTPFKSWQHTLRYPTSDASTGTSQDAKAVSAFNNIRASLQDQVYQLMTTCSDYLHFSNDDAGSSSTSCSNSLEGIHNTIHTTCGGQPSTSVKTVGHMYYLSEAAFDPVFWLHHCNVDRLFALWQTLHPSSYGASQAAPHNTWTIAKGTTQSASSPLEPFYKDAAGTTFWTSSGVQDWTVFKYTYPEYADSAGDSAAIASYVKKLYGPSATATAGSSKRDAMPEPIAAAEALPTVVPSLTAHNLSNPLHGIGSALTAANGSTYEYVANIQTPRYALAGSYVVFLFLGQPASEDPTTWLTDANLVGPMGVLSQDNMQGATVIAAGSIPLTRSLTAKLGSGPLAELTEALVGPFLKSMLSWRIAGPDGSAVDPNSVAGFKVSVYASTASDTSDMPHVLPKWSPFIPIPVATHGKPGGHPGFISPEDC